MDQLKYLFTTLNKNAVSDFFDSNRAIFPEFEDKVKTEQYAEKLSEKAEFVICQNDKQEIIGMIAFYMNMPPECYLTFVCVNAQYTKRGIMSQMLNHIEKLAQSRRFTRIKLEVKRENHTAIAAYEKNGFEKIEETAHSYYMLKSL